MSSKVLIPSLVLLSIASPALAQAPQAAPDALYCLKMEPVTGTRIGTVMCQTREQWYQDEVDLDAVWAEDGVRIIG